MAPHTPPTPAPKVQTTAWSWDKWTYRHQLEHLSVSQRASTVIQGGMKNEMMTRGSAVKQQQEEPVESTRGTFRRTSSSTEEPRKSPSDVLDCPGLSSAQQDHQRGDEAAAPRRAETPHLHLRTPLSSRCGPLPGSVSWCYNTAITAPWSRLRQQHATLSRSGVAALKAMVLLHRDAIFTTEGIIMGCLREPSAVTNNQ